MKIATIVGARPQFIKASVVSKELRKNHTEILVHTGQHYDYQMSEKFFEELDIPNPDYNLGISGGSHGQMTGRMIIGIEEVLIKEKPEWLLVYGDTNSTLAAALAAAKLHIPICHVEAGTRTHNMENPEEVNRICTDHISSLLLACTENDKKELQKEGLWEKSEIVGDTMYDAFLRFKDQLDVQELKLRQLNGIEKKVPDKFYYMTCHREENTNDAKLAEICNAMNQLDHLVIYPVHPRNRERVHRIQQVSHYGNICFVEPVGYLESVSLVSHAQKIVTDSGGLQREAFFAGKQCITILDHVTWEATMVNGRNQLAKPDCNDILSKLEKKQSVDHCYQPFGDGHAAEKIVRCIENKVK